MAVAEKSVETLEKPEAERPIAPGFQVVDERPDDQAAQRIINELNRDLDAINREREEEAAEEEAQSRRRKEQAARDAAIDRAQNPTEYDDEHPPVLEPLSKYIWQLHHMPDQPQLSAIYDANNFMVSHIDRDPDHGDEIIGLTVLVDKHHEYHVSKTKVVSTKSGVEPEMAFQMLLMAVANPLMIQQGIELVGSQEDRALLYIATRHFNAANPGPKGEEILKIVGGMDDLTPEVIEAAQARWDAMLNDVTGIEPEPEQPQPPEAAQASAEEEVPSTAALEETPAIAPERTEEPAPIVTGSTKLEQSGGFNNSAWNGLYNAPPAGSTPYSGPYGEQKIGLLKPGEYGMSAKWLEEQRRNQTETTTQQPVEETDAATAPAESAVAPEKSTDVKRVSVADYLNQSPSEEITAKLAKSNVSAEQYMDVRQHVVLTGEVSINKIRDRLAVSDRKARVILSALKEENLVVKSGPDQMAPHKVTVGLGDSIDLVTAETKAHAAQDRIEEIHAEAETITAEAAKPEIDQEAVYEQVIDRVMAEEIAARQENRASKAATGEFIRDAYVELTGEEFIYKGSKEVVGLLMRLMDDGYVVMDNNRTRIVNSEALTKARAGSQGPRNDI